MGATAGCSDRSLSASDVPLWCLGGKRARRSQRLLSRPSSTRFGRFWDERSFLGALSKRGCLCRNARARNTRSDVESPFRGPEWRRPRTKSQAARRFAHSAVSCGGTERLRLRGRLVGAFGAGVGRCARGSGFESRAFRFVGGGFGFGPRLAGCAGLCVLGTQRSVHVTRCAERCVSAAVDGAIADPTTSPAAAATTMITATMERLRSIAGGSLSRARAALTKERCCSIRGSTVGIGSPA